MNPRQRSKSDHSLGLSTLQDISTLILQSHDLDETLSNIVDIVAQRAESDVCSLYLLDHDEETLILRATRGLEPSAIGHVSLKIGEGLTGIVAADRIMLAIDEPQNHPHYRHFESIGEEQFHSFVGIPLLDRNHAIGVLVIQTRQAKQFTAEEKATLTTIAFQVGSIVVNARLLDTIDSYQTTKEQESVSEDLIDSGITLRGKIAHNGVVTSGVNIIDQNFGFADVYDECSIDIEFELTRLDEALRKTRIQTLYLEKHVADRLTAEDAAIFHTHLMILEDRSFIEKLHEKIEDRHSAPYALKKVISGYLKVFARMDDAYLRERAADMEDIGRRILANLIGKDTDVINLNQAGILVAEKLLPSEMAILDHDKILGLILESNEANSHSVIMARSLGIPAVIGVKDALATIKPDATIILDANTGCIYQNPAENIIEEYLRLEQDSQQEQEQLSALRDQPAMTIDGHRIHLRANIGLVSDVDIAQKHGAEGVGLYRTEFPYMARSSFPDRDDQYQLYKRVLEKFDGQPVTIRTLDIGGDKALPYFTPPQEDNPFMGWRSVRVSLDNRDIFQTQIEAILMAAVHGPTRLLFPMISTLGEIRACKQVIEDAVAQLKKDGIEYNRAIPIGAMIEVPAAIRLAGHLAREVDFFSLGSNDLIQYLLAADRGNPRVQSYYDPLHPAVLLTLQHLAEEVKKHNIDLCLCGEMASDPACMLALIGLSFREFSLSAPCLPKLKQLIGQIDTKEAEQLMKELLLEGESEIIRQRLEAEIERKNDQS